MSNEAITWAFSLDLPSNAKFVLVVLADKADEQHSCFPGQKQIAAMTGMTDRSVRNALAVLREAGLVRTEHRQREDGSRTSDRYFLSVGQPENISGGQEPVSAPPENDDRSNRNHVPGNEPSEEPTSNPHRDKTRASARRAGGRKQKPGSNSGLPDWFEELWRRWPGGGSPKKDTYDRWVDHAAVVGQDLLVEAFDRWVDRYGRSDQRPSSLAVWLNQERYLWPDSKLPWVEPPPHTNGAVRLTAAEQKVERQRAETEQRRADARILDAAGVTADALRIFREAGGTNHLLAEVVRTGTNPDSVLQKLREGMSAEMALAIISPRPTILSMHQPVESGGNA